MNVTGNASSYQVTGKPVLENNGVKLTELGIVSDTDSSLYGYHIFYAVENGTSDTISVGLEYNFLSINGYMTDFSDIDGDIPAGKTGILCIDIYTEAAESAESAGITSVDDIKEIEFLLCVRDENYNDILEENVKSAR